MTQQRYAKNKIKSCKIPQVLDKCELRKDLTFWGSSREREKSLFFGVFRAILSKLNLCNTLGEVQQSECQRNCGHAGTKPTAACRQSKEKGHFLLLWWFLLDGIGNSVEHSVKEVPMFTKSLQPNKTFHKTSLTVVLSRWEFS